MVAWRSAGRHIEVDLDLRPARGERQGVDQQVRDDLPNVLRAHDPRERPVRLGDDDDPRL